MCAVIDLDEDFQEALQRIPSDSQLEDLLSTMQAVIQLADEFQATVERLPMIAPRGT